MRIASSRPGLIRSVSCYLVAAVALAFALCGPARGADALDPSATTAQTATTPAASGDRPPETQEERLRYAIRRSLLSPSSYAISAAAAGFSMATDSSGDEGYGMGAEGFGRRWADRMGRTTVRELAGSWIAGSLLHQDPSYHPSPDRRLARRAGWAASRVFVTYSSDDGSQEFNTSNMIGVAAGVLASLGWNPTPEKSMTPGNFFQNWGESLAMNAVSKLVREFIHLRRPSRTP